PRVVSEPARHIDVLPTVLDALNIRAPDGLPGRSLMPAATGRRAPDDTARRAEPVTYFEALSGTLNRGWAPLFGIAIGRFKYIDLPIPELYDVEDDPHELRNLAGGQPRRVDDMRAALRALAPAGRRVEGRAEDPETRERLRSLGYFSGAGSDVDK